MTTQTHPTKDELTCPECGHKDYLENVIDGWCIKCPECGYRSRGDWDWK